MQPCKRLRFRRASQRRSGGYDADGLHSDLETDGRLAPYYGLALDRRWQLGRLFLAAEAALQNLAVVQLGLLFGSPW